MKRTNHGLDEVTTAWLQKEADKNNCSKVEIIRRLVKFAQKGRKYE